MVVWRGVASFRYLFGSSTESDWHLGGYSNCVLKQEKEKVKGQIKVLTEGKQTRKNNPR